MVGQQFFASGGLPAPGYWVGRYGKPGPVIVVDDPLAEEEIMMSYPAESVKFVRSYAGENAPIGSFPNVGKPAGLVVVNSPAAEQAVRWEYPESTVRFIRTWKGESSPVGEIAVHRASKEAVVISLVTMLIGVTVGLEGYANRRRPWGQIMLGAGASIAGTSIVMLIRDMFE